MSESIFVDGKELFSSKRAADLSGYAQDYIGQLARAGAIHAQRIGGLWYVSIDSLNSYKTESEKAKHEVVIPPQERTDLDSLISFDGKEYISAPYGAKITGYHQDYIGQLARGGKILSRQVGNRWYVEKNALIEHKKEKDGLLAAVQRESVGIAPRVSQDTTLAPKTVGVESQEPFYRYMPAEASPEHMLPLIKEPQSDFLKVAEKNTIDKTRIPITVKHMSSTRPVAQNKHIPSVPRLPEARRTISGYLAPAAIALTIMLVIATGMLSGKLSGVFAGNAKTITSLSASAASSLPKSITGGVSRIGDMLEGIFSPDIAFKRTN